MASSSLVAFRGAAASLSRRSSPLLVSAARSHEARIAAVAVSGLRAYKIVPGYPADQSPALRPTDTVATLPRSKISGSYHWIFERSLSIVTMSFMLAPAFVGAGNHIVDMGIAICVPIHAYGGWHSIVSDYLPYRKFGAVYDVVTWALRVLSALAVYGMYRLNTEDIGVTMMIKKLWEIDNWSKLTGKETK